MLWFGRRDVVEPTSGSGPPPTGSADHYDVVDLVSSEASKDACSTCASGSSSLAGSDESESDGEWNRGSGESSMEELSSKGTLHVFEILYLRNSRRRPCTQ